MDVELEDESGRVFNEIRDRDPSILFVNFLKVCFYLLWTHFSYVCFDLGTFQCQSEKLCNQFHSPNTTGVRG
jgi:hypothetical protein